MNKYHMELDIPIEFDPVYPTAPKYMQSYIMGSESHDLVVWLHMCGVVVASAELFYLTPAKTDRHPIHIDGPSQDDHVKLNFVYTDHPVLMNWFEPKTNIHTPTQQTKIESTYIRFEPEQCDLVYSAYVGTPSIVNAGCPHNVSPVVSPRYCFSFALAHASNHKRLLQWNEAADIFSKYKKHMPM